LAERGIAIKGIRLDSGDLVELSRFARDWFRQEDVAFLKIFVSGDLDEYRIHDLLERGAEIDGIGIGTRYAAARHAPAIEIVYKIIQYDGRDLCKTAPNKETHPGRKTITRIKSERYERDLVQAFDPNAPDLLQPFVTTESMAIIQQRLTRGLAALAPDIACIRDPKTYRVEFSNPE
jgi:nicotinate phosphoribosyltransferase